MIKKKYLFDISLIILIFGSIRGFFVYHFHFNPNLIYSISALLIVILSLFCVKSISIKPFNDDLKTIRKAILWNYIFLSFYTLFYIIFVGIQEISNIYEFILFPIIFYLITYKVNKLHLSIHIISFITLFGTYVFYQLGVLYGFDAIAEANLTLRPGELSYSRIGENYLPGGYLGSHHDNANILVMSTAFYFSEFLNVENKKRILFFLAFILFLSFSILTGSASNIIAFFIVFASILIYYGKKIFLILLPIFIFSYSYIEEHLYFIEKIKQDQSDLEAGGIFNSLNFGSIINSIHSILFGAGYYFNVPMVKSEVAFVKMLIGIGILPFLFIMFILFSPIYYIYLFNNRTSKLIKLFIYKDVSLYNQLLKVKKSYLRILILRATPAMTGTLTLLHYGSLFRITSIGLFCIFLSIFLKTYLNLSKSFKEYFDYNSSRSISID
jgi:hypothetical protein